MTGPDAVLVIACGAIAPELVRIVRGAQWDHVRIRCLPPHLHNRPDRIVAEVERALAIAATEGLPPQRVFVAYGDCGTGGRLDTLLIRRGIQRLPGAHCYEFVAGADAFAALAAQEPRTFYLTEFLVRNFRRLVVQGLGLDRHPQLLPQYFGNYRRLAYLVQRADPALETLAREHARFLGLKYVQYECGDAPLRSALESALEAR